LEHFNWELFDHPPYSLDLTPSDYNLFTYLRKLFRTQLFNNSDEWTEVVKTWLSSQAANFFDTGIQNFSPIRQALQFRCETA
jgi:hypothetical protein